MPGTRKLGRATDSRNAMLRAMVTYLFENGKIETTVTRAKEVRSMAEKMVTLGKQDDLHAKRQVFSYITKEDVAKKVIDEIGPKYADRNGGYTRISKLEPRRGDAADRGGSGGAADGVRVHPAATGAGTGHRRRRRRPRAGQPASQRTGQQRQGRRPAE